MGHALDICCVADLSLNDDELIAANTCGEVMGLKKVPKPGADADQQVIPRGMPEAIVDGLEAIQVKAMNGNHRARHARNTAKAFAKCNAIGKAGQRVGARKALHLKPQQDLL